MHYDALKEAGKDFHLFAMCHSCVTHLYNGIGLVGGGRIFRDKTLEDLFEVDEKEIKKGFLRLEEMGFIVTSKVFSNRRSIATIGFDNFYHPVSCVNQYDDRFDDIFGEINEIVTNSKWDVTKIKNPRWFPVYLEIHHEMMWLNG